MGRILAVNRFLVLGAVLLPTTLSMAQPAQAPANGAAPARDDTAQSAPPTVEAPAADSVPAGSTVDAPAVTSEPPVAAPEPPPAPAPQRTIVPPPAATANAAAPPVSTPEASGPKEAAAAPVQQAEPIIPGLEIQGRVMVGYELERKHPAGAQPALGDTTEPGFFLDQARLKVKAQPHERVRAVISMDINAGASVRDAYVNLRAKKALQLRLGRFRRPLSRLQNESRGKLPFRKRGLFDNAIFEDQQWGDRALGFMVHGKPVKRLRYYAAVMSPAALGSDIEGADAIARLEYGVTSWLTLGAGAAHKWTERFKDGPNLSLNALTSDIALELGGCYAALELDVAQNPNPPPIAASAAPRTPWALGFIGYAGYSAALTEDLTLGPIGVFEWMDTDLDYGQDEALRMVLGLYLTFQNPTLRVMPQVEIVRPTGKASTRSEVAEEKYYVMVSSGF